MVTPLDLISFFSLRVRWDNVTNLFLTEDEQKCFKALPGLAYKMPYVCSSVFVPFLAGWDSIKSDGLESYVLKMTRLPLAWIPE